MLRTKSQSQNRRTDVPEFENRVQPLVVEDWRVAERAVETRDPRPEPFAEDRVARGFTEHRAELTDPASSEVRIFSEAELRLLCDDPARRKERVAERADRAGDDNMNDHDSRNEQRPDPARLLRLEEQEDDRHRDQHHNCRA